MRIFIIKLWNIRGSVLNVEKLNLIPTDLITIGPEERTLYVKNVELD